jgi:hypothetical protein
MRTSVFAVSLAAALLMPEAAALAGPPWKRGYEHEARHCKYEYQSGPYGFREEYKCEGRGPRYAGGPPPWAPAHGWRRKHAHYEAGYEIPDVGIEVGRCYRDVIGAVIGGAAGGAIGSQFGRGSDRTVATIGGTIIGVLIGGAIGRSMDDADQACIAQTLEQAPPRGRLEQPRRRTVSRCAAGGLRGPRGTLLPRVPHHRDHRGAPAGGLWHRLPAARRELAPGELTLDAPAAAG